MLFTINVSITSHSQIEYSILEIKKQVLFDILSQKEKNPFFRKGFSYFLSCVYKPNSVISTRGQDNSYLSRPEITLKLKRFSANFAHHKWCKIEHPELVEGLFDLLRALNFVIAYGEQNWSTILHTRKYFAVSPELNRFVTVRNSTLAGDGRYPLRLSRFASKTVCSDFPP